MKKLTNSNLGGGGKSYLTKDKVCKTSKGCSFEHSLGVFSMHGFTLIELLAVIIILAVIALIATPIVLNVVDNAKESARQSSVAGYADATKLAVYDHMFAYNGQIPTIDQVFIDTIKPQGDTVTCKNVYFNDTYGVLLNQCHVGNLEEKKYCFAQGKVYHNCSDEEYKDIYDKVNAKPSKSLVQLLLDNYDNSSEVGLLLDDQENYYYFGTEEQVNNNYVWYGGQLWRVIQINNDHTLTLISQQPLTNIFITSADWSNDKNIYMNSQVNLWLNATKENGGVFYSGLPDRVKNNIIPTKYCIGSVENGSDHACDLQTDNVYSGLLDQIQFEKAGGKTSYLNLSISYALGNFKTSQEISTGSFSQRLVFNIGTRPVITIRDIEVNNGDGTLANAYSMQHNITNVSDIEIGEFIKVPCIGDTCDNDNYWLMRVISKDSDSIKVSLNGFAKTKSVLGGVSEYILPASHVLLPFLDSIPSKYIVEQDKDFNIGLYTTNKSDYRTVNSSIYHGKVGLPVVGELFTSNDLGSTPTGNMPTFVNINTIENRNVTADYWTMTPYNGMNGWLVRSDCQLVNNSASAMSLYIRPVVYLKNNIEIIEGFGIAENPYVLKN